MLDGLLEFRFLLPAGFDFGALQRDCRKPRTLTRGRDSASIYGSAASAALRWARLRRPLSHENVKHGKQRIDSPKLQLPLTCCLT
jgi:hypothetical protein